MDIKIYITICNTIYTVIAKVFSDSMLPSQLRGRSKFVFKILHFSATYFLKHKDYQTT